MPTPTLDALNFTQGDATWTALRAKSLGSLYWFAGTVLGYGDRIPMRDGPHKLLCRFVEKKTGAPALDDARYRKLELPREWGKTTLVTQSYAIQRICANPDIAILIANEKEQNAKDFLSEIKHQFESNELLRALFPEVIPQDLNDTTWSASRIIVNRTSGRKEPTVSVIGVGGTVTGMHYDVIICDDIISRESMENARAGSWQIMHQVNRWIHQLEPLLNSNAEPFPELIFIGCVAEGERVLMASGHWKAIQRIQLGELVASWNPATKRFVPQKVTGVWNQGISPTVTVETSRHNVTVTPNHPFLTDRGYVPADHLKIGERIYTVGTLTAASHGRKTMIADWRQASQRVVSVTPNSDRFVYDLSVEGTENFVTEGYVVHNTRWWHRDSYEHIEEAFGYGAAKQPFVLRTKLETGDVQQLLCWRLGDLAIFRRAAIENGQSTFPEKWTLDRLAKIRVRDEALFACNFMNNPSDEVTAVFREGWLQYYDWLDEDTLLWTTGEGQRKTLALGDLDVLVFVDPGGFGTRNVDDRARAAVVVVGTKDGTHFLLEAYSEKDTFLACANKLIEFCAKYGPRKLVIEQAGQQAAFIELVRRQLADQGLTTSIEAVKPGLKAKEQRILSLEPLFQQGRMVVGRSAAFHEFREQYRQFPRSARLDLLDAMSYLPSYAKRAPNRAYLDAARRHAEELDTYYSRRGLTRGG